MKHQEPSSIQPKTALPLTAPDSNTDLSAWAFSEEAQPAVAKPQPKLLAELDRTHKELRLSNIPESSYSVLADKLKRYVGNTVNIKPRAIVKGAENIALTLSKNNGELQEVVAISLKLLVTDSSLIVKSITALVNGRTSEIYDEKKFRAKKTS